MVKVETQRWGNCNFRFCPPVGGCGPIVDGFGPLVPLLVVADPETTELTSLSGNQAFAFTSLTWILSRINDKTVQKFNAQYAEMRLLAYRSVPLTVPCVFWKFEVRKRLGLKMGGGGTAFPCVLWHFNHWSHHTKHMHMHTHTVLMAIFQANLGKPVAPSVALTGRWGCHKILQPLPHPLISSTVAKCFGAKFLQAGCTSCHPTNSVKAPKANTEHRSSRDVCRLIRQAAQGPCAVWRLLSRDHCRSGRSVPVKSSEIPDFSFQDTTTARFGWIYIPKSSWSPGRDGFWRRIQQQQQQQIRESINRQSSNVIISVQCAVIECSSSRHVTQMMTSQRWLH